MSKPTKEQALTWADVINSEDIYADAVEQISDITIDSNTVTIRALDTGEPPRVPRKLLEFVLEFDRDDNVISIENKLIGGDEVDDANFSYADFEDCENCQPDPALL